MTKPKNKTKKSDASERETSANDNKSDDSAIQSNSSSSQSSKTSSSLTNAWIVSEIQNMMYGFGDCSKPLLESAKLVEAILYQQMLTLLHQSAEVATLRGARCIGLEDMLFLIRKDKVKMTRLLQYLRFKELNMALTSNITAVENDSLPHSDVNLDGKQSIQAKGKFTKVCREFLSTIDQTGELLALLDDDIFDEVKRERELRADRQTKAMGSSQYLEFAQARRASFSRKYCINRFRDWLLKEWTNDLKPNPMALEIFSYFTYETVAQIVDLALLVKQDANVSSYDGSFRGLPPVYYNEDYPCVHESLHLPKNPLNPTSPSRTLNTSSPPSPNSQIHNISKSGDHTDGAASAMKPKGKKRKREDDSDNAASIPTTVQIGSSKCIKPAEIFEAMHRYYQAGGCMTPFSKVHVPPFVKKLLCL